MDLLDIEPEGDYNAKADVEARDYADQLRSGELGLATMLPPDFHLQTLLQFLPDVSLKRQLELDADGLLAIKVKDGGEAGLKAADKALARVRADIAAIKQCFDGDDANPGPTALAYQLHKRLTGLRADFVAAGEEAIEKVSQLVIVEIRRLRAVAEEAARLAQVEADREAREAASRAKKAAEKDGADPAVVQALTTAAKTATAPPISAAAFAPAPLKGSTVAENWKARLIGTSPDGEPNTETTALNDTQRASLLKALRAVLDGKAPLALVSVNWPYANGRARGDQKTFAIDGFEAVDIGSLRGKGRRK